MGRIHRVFTSYHRCDDEDERRIFEARFGRDHQVVIPSSVALVNGFAGLQPAALRQALRATCLLDTAVTVVLIGPRTWQSKRVDWEIAASLLVADARPRSGLLGLFLHSHGAFGKREYDARTIPPRLHDNVDCGYAVLSDWSDDPTEVQDLVHLAYLNSLELEPDDRRPLFAEDRAGVRWPD